MVLVSCKLNMREPLENCIVFRKIIQLIIKNDDIMNTERWCSCLAATPHTSSKLDCGSLTQQSSLYCTPLEYASSKLDCGSYNHLSSLYQSYYSNAMVQKQLFIFCLLFHKGFDYIS